MPRAIAWAKMSILIVLASTTTTTATATTAKYASTATTTTTATKDTNSPYHPMTEYLLLASFPLILFFLRDLIIEIILKRFLK